MEEVKKITSFTYLRTGEGDRISYTYSVIDFNGKMISQNNRENFIIMDDGIGKEVQDVITFIQENYL